MKKSQNLSLLASTATVLALVGALGLHAAYQHIFSGTSWTNLLIVHEWHVIVLMTLVQMGLILTLKSLVSRPIRRVNKHLYGVATGHVEPLSLPTRVREVEELVSGVNAMVKRLAMNRDEEALTHAGKDLEDIRELVERLEPANAVAAEKIARIGRALSSVPRPSIRPQKPE